MCIFADEPRISGRPYEEIIGAVERAVRGGEFKGEAGTSLLLHTLDAHHGGSRRLLPVGLGAPQGSTGTGVRTLVELACD